MNLIVPNHLVYVVFNCYLEKFILFVIASVTIMNRKTIFLLKRNEGKTFDHDENSASLPLPKLKDTLQRYYGSLKPFGSPAELEISRRIIEDFENRIGPTLHDIVEKRSWIEKNWINRWWEKYRYHKSRLPLYPYVGMAIPLPLQVVGVPETREYCLKAAARCLFHKIEFWNYLRNEKIRPVTTVDGYNFYSMAFYKRLFGTSRIPGDPFDKIDCYFKTASQGQCPTHGIIIAKGRIFRFDCLKPNGKLISPSQLLRVLEYIRNVADSSKLGDCTAILTCDDRTSWSRNRNHLQELSEHNKSLLEIIESSIVMAYLDDHSPKDYSESSQLAITGDFHSKWSDRSNIMIIYRNGKISLIGEPSAYDGSCSGSFAFFLLLSLLEMREPTVWQQSNDDVSTSISLPFECTFDLDQHLKDEIERVANDCKARRDEVVVSHQMFDDYGRDFIRENGFSPDSYIQIILQLAYFKLHRKLPSVNETVFLRNFYCGRSETLQCCSKNTLAFVEVASNPLSTTEQILVAFRKAVQTHYDLLRAARSGNGFDRHLFALFSAAFEQNWEIPELFRDPLYERSGGRGKTLLSTRFSGFTPITGFLAPAVENGYGFYYSITAKEIYTIITVFKSSPDTSALKLSTSFHETLKQMKSILVNSVESKL